MRNKDAEDAEILAKAINDEKQNVQIIILFFSCNGKVMTYHLKFCYKCCRCRYFLCPTGWIVYNTTVKYILTFL